MGRLTTHVLDTANGKPAAGIKITLQRADTWELLGTAHTNADGRLDKPMLEGENFKAGRYQLVFHVAEYFRAKGVALPTPAFLDDVVIRFGIASESEHYHVPLLISPWSYGTYRGS